MKLPKRRLGWFAASVVAGTLLTMGVAVMAQSSPDPPKREPVRDQPGVPQPDSRPAGIRAESLIEAVNYAGMVIYPVGKHPGGGETTDAGLRDWEQGVAEVTALDAGKFAFAPDASKLPSSFQLERGGWEAANLPSGERVVSASLDYEDTRGGYPVKVGRWRPSESFGSSPFAMAAWGPEAPFEMTLGHIGSREAIFVHRRANIETEELQQVWMSDGLYLVVVEGWVDDFRVLMAFAGATNEKLSMGG